MRAPSFIIAALTGLIVNVSATYANTITFVTPTGATIGGQPVDASATFTTGSGTLSISLTDLLANPTDVGQLISDLDFTLSTGATTGSLMSSNATTIFINAGGTSSPGSTGSTGWGLNNNVAGGLQLDALGFIGPAGLIIGPSGPGGVYSNANGSIAGNGPHNPFIDGTATFVVAISGLTADSTVTGATFSFGTTAGSNVVGVPGPVVGAGLPGLVAACIGLVTLARRRRKAQAVT